MITNILICLYNSKQTKIQKREMHDEWEVCLPYAVNCGEYEEHTFGTVNTPKNPVSKECSELRNLTLRGKFQKKKMEEILHITETFKVLHLRVYCPNPYI